MGVPQVSFSFNPGSIDDKGMSTTVTIDATDENGKAGTGSVKLTSAAGSLKDGTTVTLDAKGQGTAMFSCAVASDPNCKNTVRISADWARTAGSVTSSRSIAVGPQGTGGGGGGGGDAGTTDGGTDAGNVAVQQIQYVTTTCGGATCTVMGIKGSGFNEVAQVKFKVTDTQTKPVSGVSVTFSTMNLPFGTMVSLTGTTDMLGEVVANVSTGNKIGSFSVHATLMSGTMEADSPTIGIRGAKATNKGFSFTCSPVNLDAYHSPTPPLSFKPVCTIKLVDRFGNPVGTGTSVAFKSEAGSIPNSAPTQPFVPPLGANEGYGTVIFDTIGGPFPATDVAPLPADPAQFPYPRAAEPSRTDGALTRNPRDGLVSIIAYVQGEEYFDDNNNNGVHDANEPFIDQGEPLVDNNDNGIWDPGETYLDTNNNNMWNGPNGFWDANTSIWAETRVLYTNFAEPGLGNVAPTPWGPVPKGGMQSVQVYMPDLNLNRVQSATTSMTVMHSASKGGVMLLVGSLQDGYGFDVDPVLVDVTNNGLCTPGVTPICKLKYLFGQWNRGYIGNAILTGAALTDVTPPAADVLTVSITTNGTTTQHSAAGTMQ